MGARKQQPHPKPPLCITGASCSGHCTIRRNHSFQVGSYGHCHAGRRVGQVLLIRTLAISVAAACNTIHRDVVILGFAVRGRGQAPPPPQYGQQPDAFAVEFLLRIMPLP